MLFFTMFICSQNKIQDYTLVNQHTIKEIVLNRSEDKSIWGISFIGDTLKFVLEFKDPTGSGIWGDVILFFKTNQQKATVFYSYAGSPEYSPGSYWVQLKYNGELNGDVIDDLMLRAYKHGKKQHNSKNITITGILKH